MKKGLTREIFVEKRKELKNLYEKKRKEKREEERRILKSLKNESEIWDFINRRRRRKVWKEVKVAQEEVFYEIFRRRGGDPNEKGGSSGQFASVSRKLEARRAGSKDGKPSRRRHNGSVEKDETKESGRS